jgi:DNA repair protein RecN (Recombination protein N)
MLKKLTIEQFVIIDKLSLDFQSGLTVLTGETGAGKSILLDAMGLVLGETTSPDAIRAGSDESNIDAVFSPPATHPVWKFLTEHGVITGPQQEFSIHRTLRRAGNDDILVSGKTVDLDLLKKIGAFLVEIHGQFANQTMLSPDNQLTLLDLSGAFEPEIFKNVADALHDVHRYTREMEEEDLFLTQNKRDMPRMEAMVFQFEKMGMKEGFIEEVEAEYARLLTARQSSQAFQDILAQLIAANGVVMGLSTANQTLQRYKALDAEKTGYLSELLGAALDNAREAVNEMRRLSPEYDIDTKPLDRYRDILDILQTISKEVKIPFEGLTDYFVELSAKVNRFRNGREKMAELDKHLAKAKGSYIHHAHILSERRVAAGKVLGETVTSELEPLKLGRAEFQVVVKESPSLPWTELGLNQVIFMARMNPGQPFSPITETASGGEMARLVLALKVVLQKVQTTSTLIFDEVDTGIGGAAAAAVGERIALLADNTQVMVITHSPQVASRGDHHLHVSKQTDGITTQSVVRMLSREEGIDEISRMLSGDTITPESKAAAQSLINEAQNAKVRRKASV